MAYGRRHGDQDHAARPPRFIGWDSALNVIPFALAILVAPFVGSFLGVLVRRLPVGRPVMFDRSRCESCGHALGFAELMPVVSYFSRRGRCQHCDAPIAPMHPAIELAAIAVPLSAMTAVSGVAAFWVDCAFGWALLALGWIDWIHLRLPDVLTLPLLLAGLVVTAWFDPVMAPGHALAAAIGFAALRLLALGYHAWCGREGLGAGDAKLLAAVGAWSGMASLGPVLLSAAAAGVVVALLRGGPLRAGTVIPLGTCIAVAGWAMRLLQPTG